MLGMDKREYIVDSEQKMEEVAKVVLDTLKLGGSTAKLWALNGDLGTGKTTFTKGLAKQLGIVEPITSPTFVIQKAYNIPPQTARQGLAVDGIRQLVHIDAYRLESGTDMGVLDFNKTLADPNTLIVIEWPENIKSALPKDVLNMTFEYIDDTTRKVCINATI